MRSVTGFSLWKSQELIRLREVPVRAFRIESPLKKRRMSDLGHFETSRHIVAAAGPPPIADLRPGGWLRRRRHGDRKSGMAAGVKPRSREAVRLRARGFTRDYR
jgi:hypothetical protein